MSRRRRAIGAGHKREPGWHFSKPHDFINSNLYGQLSNSAKVLVDDIGVQYKLDNNGQLRATFEKLKHRGWGSEATLFKARKELEAAGVLFETRKGGRPNRATWYALTFFDLDPHPDYDVGRGAYPGKGSWRFNSLNGPIASRPAKALLQELKPASAHSAKYRSKGSVQTSKTVAIRPVVHRLATSISEEDLRGLPVCRQVDGAGEGRRAKRARRGAGSSSVPSPTVSDAARVAPTATIDTGRPPSRQAGLASSPDKLAAPLELQGQLPATYVGAHVRRGNGQHRGLAEQSPPCARKGMGRVHCKAATYATVKRWITDTGRPEASAASFLGLRLKPFNDDVVLRVLQDCVDAAPADVEAWLIDRLNQEKGEQHGERDHR